MITLTLATPADAPALLEIYRPYVEKTAITFETAVPETEAFSERIREISARFPYLVAREDGVPVGYAYAHPFHQRAAYDWTLETTVYIREDQRGRGLGRMLYEALIRLLKAQGAACLVAVVTVPNEPSVAFHRALGFRDGGGIPGSGWKLGTWYGIAYLYLPLLEDGAAPSPLRSVQELPRSILRAALQLPG